MPEIYPYKLFSFSSEDDLYPAKNLLKGSSSYQWKCKDPSEKHAFIEFQFEALTRFTRIEMGNNSSAFIEIQVSRLSAENDYQVLLGSTSLMSPAEALKCENLHRVRCFNEHSFFKSVAQEKWNVLKLICSQPFNKTLQYGLSFIKFYGEINCDIKVTDSSIVSGESRIDVTQLMMFQETDEDNLRPGCLFTNKIKSGNLSTNSVYSSKTEERTNLAQVSNHTTISRAETTNFTKPLPNNLSNRNLTESHQGVVDNIEMLVQTQPIYTDFSAVAESQKKIKEIVKRNLSDRSHDNSQTIKVPQSSNDADADNYRKSVSNEPLSKKFKMDSSKNSNSVSNGTKGIKESKLSRDRQSMKTETHGSSSSSLASNTPTNSPGNVGKYKNPNDNPASSSSCSSDTRNPSNDGLLSNVIFALSGYQNPLRNTLRDKALSLGANYRPSWTNDCTHLICAYSNTPKFKEVCGKGIIVSEKWILDCHSKKKLLPWRDYRVKGALSPSKMTNNNSKKISGTSVGSAIPVNMKASSSSNSGSVIPMKVGKPAPLIEVDTHTNETTTGMSQMSMIDALPQLPTTFQDQHFFFYGNFDPVDLRFLERLIMTFAGVVHNYMDPEVTIVITDCSWDPDFQTALDSNPNLKFVKPEWLHCCDEKGLSVPFGEFEIRKS